MEERQQQRQTRLDRILKQSTWQVLRDRHIAHL